MAYKTFDNYSNNSQPNKPSDSPDQNISFDQGAHSAELPDSTFVKDANLARDGADLVLETDNGTIVVEGYFTADPAPNLTAPDGATLTPDLVNSFLSSGHEYANAGSGINDASPIGAVQEVSGEVIVTRTDGTTEKVGLGTPIFQGDIVETDEDGAVNIMFVDETSFAVSEDARLAIDEYVFDASTQSGTSNFSVLKGVFVFTSGLIGRDDPDDVMIDTPSGSIGIRGTIIAGDVNTGEITVIEGAIVLTDFKGNSITLSNQFETARFDTSSNTIEHIGDLSANDVSAKFMSVSTVAADLFSSIQDASNDAGENTNSTETNDAVETQDNESDNPAQETNAADTPEDMPQDVPEAPVIESDTDITAEAEIDTVEDIITSDEIVETETEYGEPNEGDGIEVESVESSDEPVPDAPPPAPPPEAPPPTPLFNIEVTKFDVVENDAGANVMLVQGLFTDFTNLTLVGVSQNYYQIVRTGDNDFLIKLKPGVSYDAENPYPLLLNAQNENGSINFNRAINLNTTDIDENILLTNEMPTNFFSASADSNFVYNFSQEFSDPEGNITEYVLVDGSGNPITLDSSFNSNIESASFDSVTGILGIRFISGADGFDGDLNFDFSVEAITDSGQTETTNVSFDTISSSTDNGIITGSNQIYAGTDVEINVLGSNATVFADSDNADNEINVTGANAFVKAGEGNDTLNLVGGNYEVYGDAGDDTFDILNTNGQSYGGEGKDLFIAHQALQANTVIDGGSGRDVLQLDYSGNINLNVGTLSNLEVINAENGSSNVISLDYSNVINMTDDDNRLVIKMDGDDQFNLSNTDHVFENIGQETGEGGNVYDIFTDGTITLLIDTDGTHNIVT